MKKWHRVLITLAIVTLVGFVVAVDGSEKVLGRAVALSSVFTGLLTLTGFLFTARTFITFKLHEVVYSHDEYRKRVKELQADGAYDKKLYDPLREIDSIVGRTCICVFATMLVVLTFSVLPKEWSQLSSSAVDLFGEYTRTHAPLPAWLGRFLIYQVATVVVFSIIFAVALEVFATIMSVNKNIRAIINEWEERYEEKPRS